MGESWGSTGKGRIEGVGGESFRVEKAGVLRVEELLDIGLTGLVLGLGGS